MNLPSVLLGATLLQLSVSSGSAVEWTVDNFPRTLSGVRAAVNAQELPLSARIALLNSLANTYAEVNPYIRLMRNVRKADPSRMLRQLMQKRRLLASQSAFDFHMSVRRICQRGDDFHSIYMPPNPLRSGLAYLAPPAEARLFYARRSSTSSPVARVALVGKGVPGGFVTATHVDGVPVLEAARALGRAGYTTNVHADLQRGVQALAQRFLTLDPFPRRDYVTFTVSTKGMRKKLRFKWAVRPIIDPGQTFLGLAAGNPFYVPETPPPSSSVQKIRPIAIAPPLNLFLTAYAVSLPSGTEFGVLRTRTFDFIGVPPVVAELSSVLAAMPRGGLVVDIRSDLGGQGDAALLLSELLTNTTAPLMRGQVRASDTVARLLDSRPGNPLATVLSAQIVAPVTQARAAGEFLSPPIGDILTALTGTGRRPRAAQVYTGPVIALTNALTYSAGELLTTLLKDLPGSGVTVIGMDSTTGGGACGPFRHSDLVALFPDAFSPLPNDLDYTSCVTRYFRAGVRAGEYIEQYGIEGDERYYPTRRDVAKHDADLFKYLGEKFSNMTSS